MIIERYGDNLQQLAVITVFMFFVVSVILFLVHSLERATLKISVC